MAPWLLIAALLGAGLGDPLGPFRGQPVLSVDVEAPSDEDIELIYSLIEIQPGYLLSTEDLQASIKRIYSLGRYANVRVSAQRLSGVVLLTFHLVPRRRLGSIEIQGLDQVAPERLRGALGLRPGAELDSRTPQRLAGRAMEYLREAGFPEAEVEVRDLDPHSEEAERRLVMVVHEGTPRRVEAVRFQGAPRVRDAVLRAVVKTRAGAILDRHQINADRQRLEQAYLERGFLRVRVGDPEVDEATGVVHFSVWAGDRIDIALQGNRLATDATLWELWPSDSRRLEEGTLRRFRAAIADYYRRRGYADVQVTVEGLRDAGRGLVRYVVHVDEGAPVRVRSVRFTGAHSIEPEVLADQVRALVAAELEPDEALERSLPLGREVAQLTEADVELSLVGSRPWSRVAREVHESPVPPEERWVEEVYEGALDAIAAVYVARGFLSVEVSPPRVQRDGAVLDVHVHVEEGPRTYVRSVGFEGNQAFAGSELLEEVEAHSGADDEATRIALGGPYSPPGAEEGRIAIVRRYREHGYLYARVFLDVHTSADGTLADVSYRIEEGPQVRLRNVLVRGNQYTDTDVIKSRMSLRKGDLYRLDKALADRRAIADLGVFSNVRVTLLDEERPAERKDLITEVTERNRQVIEPFVGISSAEGLRLGMSYAHTNVFGNATVIDVDAKFNRQLFFTLYGPYSQQMEERYDSYNPAEQITKALERDLRAGIRSRRLGAPPLAVALRGDVAWSNVNRVFYSSDEVSASAGVDFLPSERFSLSVAPRISRSLVDCPEVVVAVEDPEQAVDAQTECLRGLGRLLPRGERLAFQVGPSFTVDQRNDRFRPTAGFWLSGGMTYAVGESRAPVGPDAAPEDARPQPFSFAKLQGEIIGYIPLFGPVLVLTAKAGHILLIDGTEIGIEDRFQLGGRDTLRGFVESTLVPADVCVGAAQGTGGCTSTLPFESGRPPLTPGGNTFMLLRAELRIPVLDSLSLDLFVDVGNLWVEFPTESEVRARPELLIPRVGVGAGLRYDTPVGALVLDIGFNPDRRPWENPVEPHFSLTRF